MNSGIENSPHPKYEPEIYNKYEKENSPNFSNTILPYSPPTFAKEQKIEDFRYNSRPSNEVPPTVQQELYPIEHPISPDTLQPSPSPETKHKISIEVSKEQANSNLYPSVMDVPNTSDEKNDLKSL